MVQRDQRKGAEGPENERVGHAGQRPLANHLCLAQHLPDEVAHALADGEEMEVRVFLRLQDSLENGPKRRQKAYAEAAASAAKSTSPGGEVRGFGQGWQEKIIGRPSIFAAAVDRSRNLQVKFSLGKRHFSQQPRCHMVPVKMP